jgi:hypothetical protein
MRVITLSPKECAWGIEVGYKRMFESPKQGYKDSRELADAPIRTKIWIDVNGACGELAACLALNVDWSASVNTPDDPDIVIGENKIDVKTADRHGKRLLIPGHNINNRLDWWYLHVTGCIPTYHVWGAIKVKDAFEVGSYEDPDGRGWASFVDKVDLTKKFM